MKKILDDFYYGNIVPDEQYIVKGSEYEKEMNHILSNLSAVFLIISYQQGTVEDFHLQNDRSSQHLLH